MHPLSPSAKPWEGWDASLRGDATGHPRGFRGQLLSRIRMPWPLWEFLCIPRSFMNRLPPWSFSLSCGRCAQDHVSRESSSGSIYSSTLRPASSSNFIAMTPVAGLSPRFFPRLRPWASLPFLLRSTCSCDKEVKKVRSNVVRSSEPIFS